MNKQYIVVLTANAENISTTKLVVDSLLAWIAAWISERPGHITAYKENAFEDVFYFFSDYTEHSGNNF